MSINKQGIVTTIIVLLLVFVFPSSTSSLLFILKDHGHTEPKNDAGQMEVLDVHGQYHPVETPALLLSKQKEFVSEFSKLPVKLKKNAILAQERCPAYMMKDSFIRMFLRSEYFHADLAAIRYVHYWDKRVQHFGPVRAFQPLTLESMRDDMAALNVGFINIVERNDIVQNKQVDKRTFLFVDPSKQDRTKYTRESMIRAIWYIAHKVLEDCDEVQKRGFVCLAYPKNTHFSQVDLPMYKELLSNARNCLPVRFSAVHICHPPPFFRIVWPIVSKLMSKRIRRSVQVHAGSHDEVLNTLRSIYGFEMEDIPVDLGGKCQAEKYSSWLVEQKQ
jgi:CRAL/TRIO domain